MKNTLLLAIILFFLHTAQAQTLTLDPTFGNNGSVEFPAMPYWWPNNAYFQDIIPSSDDNIWLLSVHPESNDWKILTCLNKNGSINTNFGNNGQVVLGKNSGFNTFEGSAICQNGKMLILSSAKSGDGSCIDPIVQRQAILRLHKNGNIDSTFAVNGLIDWYTVNNLLYFSKINKLETGGFIVARYNNQTYAFNEILEFDANGAMLPNPIHLKIDPNWNLNKILSVTKDINHKYLVVLSNYFNTYLGRFLEDGTLDLTYGNQGFIEIAKEYYYNEVQVFTTSKLILAGNFDPSGGLSLLAVNVETGLLDNTFGNNGLYVFKFDSTNQNAYKFVKYDALKGWLGVQWINGFTEIIHLNPDLSPNLNLGPDGHGILPIQTDAFSKTIALNADQKILFGGTIKAGTTFSHKFFRFQGLNTTSTSNEPAIKTDAFLVSPNPAIDYITLKGTANIGTLAIYASNGSCVLFQTHPGPQIDLQNLMAGVYFIKLYDQDGKFLGNKRFVKQ